jgi:hypothetical protein
MARADAHACNVRQCICWQTEKPDFPGSSDGNKKRRAREGRAFFVNPKVLVRDVVFDGIGRVFNHSATGLNILPGACDRVAGSNHQGDESKTGDFHCIFHDLSFPLDTDYPTSLDVIGSRPFFRNRRRARPLFMHRQSR